LNTFHFARYYFSCYEISSAVDGIYQQLSLVCQDAASGKVGCLPQQQPQQWQNLPQSAGFSHGHSKTSAESASWEDLAAAVKGAGK